LKSRIIHLIGEKTAKKETSLTFLMDETVQREIYPSTNHGIFEKLFTII
jgi:hypothetical protein